MGISDLVRSCCATSWVDAVPVLFAWPENADIQAIYWSIMFWLARIIDVSEPVRSAMDNLLLRPSLTAAKAGHSNDQRRSKP